MYAIYRFDTNQHRVDFHGTEAEALSFCRQLYYDMSKMVSYYYKEII